LRGDKLRGGFNLVRMKGRDDQWLLIKSDDEFAKPGWALELRSGERLEETGEARKKKREGRGRRPVKKLRHDVDEAPDYARTVAIDVQEGHVVDYLVCDNSATLLYVANLGAIELHPWNSRTRNPDHPDWVVFDLDPGEGVAFAAICEVALLLKDVMSRAGLECFAKTSGSRGIHVYAPLKPVHGYEEVADFAERAASIVAREIPRLATVERSLRKRPRRTVYVDHLQNARGKSVVAPYSARPRPGATVSAPLDWAEVKKGKITPQDFTIENMLKRIERKGDLFKPTLKLRQRLGASALSI
jgi:bifunctional non-homologous end joining protein LigD